MNKFETKITKIRIKMKVLVPSIICEENRRKVSCEAFSFQMSFVFSGIFILQSRGSNQKICEDLPFI